MGDGAANPYTMVATILQAAKLGYLNKYDLPPAETADCLETQDARDGVATDLAGALDDLVADRTLVAAVGEELVENHVFIKRHEIDRVGALEGDAKRDYYIHYV